MTYIPNCKVLYIIERFSKNLCYQSNFLFTFCIVKCSLKGRVHKDFVMTQSTLMLGFVAVWLEQMVCYCLCTFNFKVTFEMKSFNECLCGRMRWWRHANCTFSSSSSLLARVPPAAGKDIAAFASSGRRRYSKQCRTAGKKVSRSHGPTSSTLSKLWRKMCQPFRG